MKSESARALGVVALIFAVVGTLIPSPNGGFFLSVIATLIALPAAIFGSGRARLGAALVCVLALALAVAGFPEMRKDQATYAEVTKRKNTATGVPAPDLSGQVPPTGTDKVK